MTPGPPTIALAALVGVVGAWRSLLVGALEEPAKLLLPLIAFAACGHRRTADGLVRGVAAGMGFAAFEAGSPRAHERRD